MKISKNAVFCCLLTLVVFSLSACGGLTHSDKPATKTWWLKPYVDLNKSDHTHPLSKVAISVRAVPGLDTDRILTLADNAELNQFAAARWADNLPELINSLMGRTLDASGRFEVLSDRAGGGPEDCNLNLEIREFFAHLDPSGQTTRVQVSIDGRYHCESAAPLLVRLNASIPVHDDRMSGIVAAFQQAMDDVMKDLLRQL
jgi:cholesterol transport system auxiliary component